MNERQQIINIPYSGYSATPSDYDCPDGQLATAMNVVVEDGSLKPVLPAGKVTQPWTYARDSDGGTKFPVTVIFCHKNNNWVHYIGLCEPEEGKLVYCYTQYPANVDENGEVDDGTVDAWNSPNQWACMKEFDGDDDIHGTTQIIEGETHKSITAVGNTLIISTNKNIRYYLWMDKEWEEDGVTRIFNGYKYLGTSVPRGKMEFALSGELLGKVYKPGIQINDNSSTADENWTIYYEHLYSDVQAWGSGQDYIYDDNVTFEAGVEYAVSISYDFEYGGTTTWVLEGKLEDGSYERILSTNFSVQRCKFTAKKKCTGIRFIITLGHKKYYTIPLRFEVGATTGLSSIKSIAYNADNYSALMSVMNSFVNTQATGKNRFIYPFFVRYATKLYDGSYVNISPPILMRPNTGYVPLMQFNISNASATGDVTSYAFVADLMGRATESIGEDWADIITSVDIFLSQPIYPYRQGQEYEATEQLYSYLVYNKNNAGSVKNMENHSYGYLRMDNAVTDGYKRLGLWSSMLKKYATLATNDEVDFVKIAPVDDVKEKLKNVSAFYHVKSLRRDKYNEMAVGAETGSDGNKTFNNAFTKIDLEDGTLSNLVTREALTDELIGNRVFRSASAYSYNKRLHLYGAEYRLPEPTTIDGCNGYFEVDESEDESFMKDGFIINNPIAKHHYTAVMKTYVTLMTDEGDKVVCHETTESEIAACKFWNYNKPWFFYPDNRARSIKIYNENGTLYRELALKEHELLNGAYWCGGSVDGSSDYVAITEIVLKPYEQPNIDDLIKTSTSIYVSEVNNPFAFKSENVVSIGAARIIGIASAAKAMSTGQFGQFPLYCFTDNGVWALELTSTGVYKSTQPITRDVCISAESITQMDGSVLFATARGIMELTGSSSDCISDNLEADDMFVPANLPKVEALLKYVNAGSSVTVDKDTVSFVSFILFCSDSRIIYDYVRQRIIVYNPAYRYAYVFSLKSKTWGMMQSNIKSHLNSYPDALYMSTDGWLCDFNAAYNITVLDESDDDGKLYKEEAITGVNGLVVTRPLKLGSQDIHKTVDTMIQRGYFKTGHVQSVLYASNDLFNWKAIWSSANEYMRGMAGTPYKYFRVGLICKLDTDESISGMTVRFEPRLTNRPR